MSHRIAILGLALAALAACGEGKKEPAADPAPFKAALEAYMNEKKYGMTIESVEELTVEGDRASAAFRLSAASTGMKPRWDVTFKRAGTGWAVDQVKRK